jgi:hypothetical protein
MCLLPVDSMMIEMALQYSPCGELKSREAAFQD